MGPFYGEFLRWHETGKPHERDIQGERALMQATARNFGCEAVNSRE